MPFDAAIYRRRSIRLKEYDYAQPGAYFVTICTYRWVPLFGSVMDRMIALNPNGRAVEKEWLRTAKMRPEVHLDKYVVMPNHVHGIIMIVHDGRRGTLQRAPTIERYGQPVPSSLPTIIRGFKSAATKRINKDSGMPGEPLWQRNYYEHIIRDDRDLNRIRAYIHQNPARWHLDRYNPDAVGSDEFEPQLQAGL